jgi:hypothetical protein
MATAMLITTNIIKNVSEHNLTAAKSAQ